jgi:uncharacterized protein YjbI with pentapeptide repeats
MALKRITQPDLDEILIMHELWLSTYGNEGRQANLEGCNLCDLEFVKVNLREISFAESDLSAARFESIRGLCASAFRRANLAGTTLPEGFEGWGLEGIESLIKRGRTILLLLLAICAYAILTANITSDDVLITDRAVADLPIIKVQVSIVRFFQLAPIFLLLAYWYLLSQIDILLGRLAQLPAILPDGHPTLEHLHPWMLLDVLGYSGTEGPAWLRSINRWLTLIFSCWAVPLTIVVLWARFLPRQDNISYYHVAIICIAAVIGFAHLRLARRLPHTQVTQSFRHPNKKFRFQLIFMVIAAFLLSVVSYGSIQGYRWDYIPRYIGPPRPPLVSPRVWAPFLLHSLAWGSFGDAESRNLSKKMESGEIESAALSGQSMRFLIAPFSNLENANLEKANLFAANLKRTNLAKSDLSSACLLEADLSFADLSGANLSYAWLIGANLQDVVVDDNTKWDNAVLDGTEISCELFKKLIDDGGGAISFCHVCLEVPLEDYDEEECPYFPEDPPEACEPLPRDLFNPKYTDR